MNITNANDLFTLLRWVTCERDERGPVPAVRAAEAVERLADRAHKTLSAGPTGAQARASFEALISGRQVCRYCGCTDDIACEGGCSWVEIDLCSSCQTAVA